MSTDGGSKNTTTTVSQSDPWSGQQPYLTQGFQQASNLYNNNPLQYYPGQTYAPVSGETNAALTAQTNRAMQGSPLTGAAQGELMKTLSGDYLDAAKNPYLTAASDSIMAKTLPAINSRFAASGRGQSGLGARAAGEGVSSAMAQAAMQNYNNERTNMQRAQLFAPQLANQDYFDIAKLGEVGAARESADQQGITEAMNRFNFQNQAPWQQLQNYMGMIQGNYGGTQTGTSVGPRKSVGAGLLGGGIAGAGLGYLGGKELGFDPVKGALAGGGLGSLLGLL
jgi:hypothetical protein